MKTIPSIICTLALLAGTIAFAAPPVNRAQELVDSALVDFKDNKYDPAITKLKEANELAPNSPFILNLLGAALTKKKDYEAATGYFNKALEVEYSFFPARFNLGEVLFLQKRYPQALDYFTKLLRDSPGNELLQFKVVLCLLQTDQVDNAKKLASQMKFPGQEPAWYYAQASIALHEGNKKAAMKYLDNANVFFSGKTQLYQETFQDLGWPTR